MIQALTTFNNFLSRKNLKDQWPTILRCFGEIGVICVSNQGQFVTFFVELATHNYCQYHPLSSQTAAQIPRSYTEQVVNLRPAHPEHLDKGGCQMPKARFPHLEGLWGWRKDQLMKVYKTLQLSLLTYAALAWQPWAAPSRIEQLERCKNKPPEGGDRATQIHPS